MVLYSNRIMTLESKHCTEVINETDPSATFAVSLCDTVPVAVAIVVPESTDEFSSKLRQPCTTRAEGVVAICVILSELVLLASFPLLSVNFTAAMVVMIISGLTLCLSICYGIYIQRGTGGDGEGGTYY